MSPGRGRPSGEQRRVESLRRLGVLDEPPSKDLQDVAILVARLLPAPLATVTFVTAEKAHSLAVSGHERPFTVPRAASPAAQIIDADQEVATLEVGGATFEDHPIRAAVPDVRTVVAAVIRAPDGQPVGAVEAALAGDSELDERAFRLLSRAAEHAARLLELRGEVEEYRRFIELHPDAVAVLDLDGNIELANPALATLLGAEDSSALLGEPFMELIVKPDRARVVTELARVLFGRRTTASLDMGMLHRDGHVRLCSVTAGHLQGSRRSVQLAIRDLDERIRGEAERSRLSEQLAQAQRLDLAGRLASGLAHDLNNLLVIMTSNLDLALESVRRLENGEESPRPLQEDLGQLRVAVDRAGELTSKLLGFARREPAERAEADLVGCAEAVERLVSASLSDGVELNLALEPGLPQVAVDPGQLEQALVNLVLNAVDALPEGGRIDLRAVRIRPDPLAAPEPDTTAQGEQHVYLEVSDDGVGMGQETRTRVFEPLFTTKAGGRGSGLGLPTVQAFVEEYGGVIDLTSSSGKGTTVSMLLPAVVEEAVVLDERRLVGGARVLLVDPGEQVRRVLTRMLETAGYRVRAVASARAAVTSFAEHGADVLAAETLLPDGTGWSLLEQLRDQAPGLPGLLFATSDAVADLDGVRTLAKPFGHDRLLQALEELLHPVR